MRICFLTYRGNMFSGGQGVYAYYLTRELVKLGCEVHLISRPLYPKVPEGVYLHKAANHDFFFG